MCSNDEDLVKRCKAYSEADLGTTLLGEANAATWRAKRMAHLQKQDKKKLFKEAKQKRAQAYNHFGKAGQFFSEISMLKHAASCFYTAQSYEQAG
jgi:hypothetical protein